jgi:hypothetical protein
MLTVIQEGRRGSHLALEMTPPVEVASTTTATSTATPSHSGECAAVVGQPIAAPPAALGPFGAQARVTLLKVYRTKLLLACQSPCFPETWTAQLSGAADEPRWEQTQNARQ